MLNALFFQPTRWCGLNCKGCYVKAHEDGEESPHVTWHEWRHLFHLFYKGVHWANQITIAVDDLHRDVHKRREMVLIVDSILEEMRLNKTDQEHPEVHFTMHTPDTFLSYLEEQIAGWQNLSLVSFSEMPTHERGVRVYKQFKQWGVPINYNMMVPTKAFHAQAEIDHLVSLASTYADHINLVMFKTPVGANDPYAIDKGKEAWQRYQLYISEVVDKLPEDARRKVSTDGCMSDTIKHSRTNFGCSANVSRMQVWPDGSVSGCPYAFSGNTAGARTAENILENLRAARKQYDFRERCHLPRVYSPLSGRQGFRILQLS